MRQYLNRYKFCALFLGVIFLSCACHSRPPISPEQQAGLKLLRVTNDMRQGSLANTETSKALIQRLYPIFESKGCDKASGHKSYIFLNSIQDTDVQRQWVERWMVYGCGAVYPVDVHFAQKKSQDSIEKNNTETWEVKAPDPSLNQT